MSGIPDARPGEPITFEEAEEACVRLQSEIARARDVLREYKASLGAEPSDNDNRQGLS